MSEKDWKPKRVGGDKAESSSSVCVVEISVGSTECRGALETALSGIEGVRIKAQGSPEVPSVMIMELSSNPEETFAVIREIGKLANGSEVFLTAAVLDSAILLEAMRAGAKEYLPQPIKKEEVESAFRRFKERAAVRPGPGAEKRKTGKVFAFFGGKGGVGTTSIAVNLAAALKNRPDKPTVVLVDVNQHGGDLPLYLDLQPNHSFRDIATDLSRLDQAFLIRILTKTESGLQVLASGYDDLSTGRLNPDCVEATLKLLQIHFDYVVLDCGHVLDLTTKKALELASLIFVTSTLMVPVVHRTKRILELLRGSGFPPDKIRLVMNRYLPAEQEVLKETEDILKQKTYWFFPNDYPSVSQAVNGGKPIIEMASRSQVAKAFKEFALSFETKSKAGSARGYLGSWLNPFKSRQSSVSA